MSCRFSDGARLIFVPSQRGNLENQLTEAEERGELAIKETKARARDLEDALQRAKQDMARQLREYQVCRRGTSHMCGNTIQQESLANSKNLIFTQVTKRWQMRFF